MQMVCRCIEGMAGVDMISVLSNDVVLCSDLSSKDYPSNAVKEWELHCLQSEKFPLC